MPARQCLLMGHLAEQSRFWEDFRLFDSRKRTNSQRRHAMRDFSYGRLVRRELRGASFPTRICSAVGTEIVAVVLAIAP